MDATNLNTADVLVVNSQEIFNYQPKRKLNVINDNDVFSLLDKNFTYVLSFHPISPYTQDAESKNTEIKNFLEAKDIKCSSDFINIDDAHYLNLDAFDWQNDSTTAFYPILSLDGTCLYDSSSLEQCEFYNCFTVFIYKGVLHQVINDATTQPALVHCKINLDNIKEIQNKYYHLILTRNDNIFSMHLIFDKNSLLSSYNVNMCDLLDPSYRYIESDNTNVINLTTTNGDGTIPFDGTTVSTFTISDDSVDMMNIQFETGDYEGVIGVEVVFDNGRYCKLLTNYILQNDNYAFIPVNIPDQYDRFEHYNEPSLTIYVNEDPYDTDFTTSDIIDGIVKVSVEKNKSYSVVIENLQLYTDYLKSAFNSINVIKNDEEYNFMNTSHVTIKLHMNYTDDVTFQQDDYNKFRSDHVILYNNLNISNLISPDSTICIGYLERQPKNIEIDKKLYKNSFLGYVTEFSFFKDQSYLQKFEKLIDFSLSKYLLTYQSEETFSISPNYNQFYDGYNIEKSDENIYSTKIIRNKILINNNNIPAICPIMTNHEDLYCSNPWFNKDGSTLELDGTSTDDTGGGGGAPLVTINEAGVAFPMLQQVTNFKIGDIALVDGMGFPNIEADYNTYIKKQTENTNISFIGEQEEGDTTQTIYNNDSIFCIFNFDIMKDVDLPDNYNVQNQMRFLMKSDYTLIPYDENLSYEEYCLMDSTDNYIDINFQKTINDKQSVISTLNNYIETIKENENNLYITRFYITCFRDSRYLFIYNTYSDLPSTSTYNEHSDFIISVTNTNKMYGEKLIDTNYSKLVSPYYTNFLQQYGGKESFYVALWNDDLVDYEYNPNEYSSYLLNGFYYTKNNNTDRSLSIDWVCSLDFYEPDLNIYKYEKIINGITPDRRQMGSQYFHFDLNYFDKLQIIDQDRIVYAEQDGESVSDTLYRNFDYNLYFNDSTHTEFIQDLNKFYYVNILSLIKPEKTYILQNVNLLNGSSIQLANVTNLGYNDSGQVVFQYNPGDVSDKSQLVITYDLTGNNTERYKQALSHVVNQEYALYNPMGVYPDFKVDKKSVFVEDWELKNNTNYAIKTTQSKDIYTLTKNNGISNFVYNKIAFEQYDNRFILKNVTEKRRNTFLHSYITYSHVDYPFYSNLYIPINVIYDGNKRSIENK